MSRHQLTIFISHWSNLSVTLLKFSKETGSFNHFNLWNSCFFAEYKYSVYVFHNIIFFIIHIQFFLNCSITLQISYIHYHLSLIWRIQIFFCSKIWKTSSTFLILESWRSWLRVFKKRKQEFQHIDSLQYIYFLFIQTSWLQFLWFWFKNNYFLFITFTFTH